MTTPDVERVARAINEANGCPPYMWVDWVVDARAAMAATLELAAEEARVVTSSPFHAWGCEIALWLQQRANEVKETGRG